MTRARFVVGAIGLLGGLVALAGALRTGWYTRVWLDDSAPCQLAGQCSPADIEAGLRRLWFVVGGGLGVLVLAAVLLAWTLSLTPRRPAAPARAAPVHALVAGLITCGVALCAGLPLLIAAFSGPHFLAVALVGAWFAQAGGVLLAARVVRSQLPTPRHEWLTALLVSAVGVGAVVLTWVVDSSESLTELPVVDAVAVAAAVLVQRSLQALREPPAWRAVAGGVAVLTVGVLLLAALLVPAPTVPPASTAPSTGVTPSVPAPVPEPVPAPPPAPSPPSSPTPVVADVPCASSDLTFAVGGFDAAMGARAAAVQATNTGTAPCWLEGVPVVVLLQGGRPLALQVLPGETPQGDPASVERVGVAPGMSAFALLTWRSYGGWADAETAQVLTVALDASSTLTAATVPEDVGPAPFDIADGGAWGVAPWSSPWN
ncbi:DUF4232 domain-containing protein [Blastococcus sp. TF02-09]|uniref:DUF4232 domain-containing protein n=1 Tax=Blastococcus sp. TF02-09 TaxID=2250576 RepID=UPI0013140EC5|nr:DUF4232 domain-containing protein [Blastococcus sp. TF02-9]